MAAVGGLLAVDLGALAFAKNWAGPARLTSQRFLDGFATVFGQHPGFRKNHAKGVVVSGHFESNGEGRGLSRAGLFSVGRTPVTGRFSLSGGNPHVVDSLSLARGLGLVFSFPGAQQWRMAMLNLPVFPDNSPEGFLDRLVASKALADTGKPDPEAMSQFLSRHPETERAMKIINQTPPSLGFTDSTYGSLITFYFADESGIRTPVRWSFVPMQGAYPPQSGNNALFDALIRQLRSGPLRWRLVLTVGTPADPVDDATLPWPADRRQVEAGILTLTSIETERRGNARDINFDPMVLPDGIEPSDDPLLAARSVVYAASFRRRSDRTPSPSAVQVDAVQP